MPTCEQDTLREVDRQGITIDRCDKCRGVWLDRGELEKLTGPKRAEEEDDDDDGRDERRGGRRGGFLSNLFDFD